ncbi:hypothetical protein AXF42_Ash008868 [Apostasia shenzhenica]|uniref:Glucan endo-1,3-beta-glucosidase GVI n=1 Tax=Apostasia shenzhenica TaxID=1088818 RepID=A0A2I0ASQ3_9ASPA|nr:hypothetical protein AXF42_Ash008868 [Apostasia shenzhenica]
MDRGSLLRLPAAMALLLSGFAVLAGAQGIGVNYGMKGDNLPSPAAVVSLCKSRGIDKLRLFYPDTDALQALAGSGISVILGVFNEDLPQLAGDATFAVSWVHANVLPFAADVSFRCIDVGNELIPGNSSASVLPAMRNIDAALQAAGVRIPVTTAISTVPLATSFPPSQGAFSDETVGYLNPILSFLATAGSPLLVNVYPFFAYSGSPGEVRLDYALFTAGGVVVQDGELGYTNMFDAMVDSVRSAVERAGAPGLELVVSETGWPSADDTGATVENAMIYVNNLVRHVNLKQGTPKCPGQEMEVYLFAMFNEDEKPAGSERNFGIFYPDMTEVYHVDFNS